MQSHGYDLAALELLPRQPWESDDDYADRARVCRMGDSLAAYLREKAATPITSSQGRPADTTSP
jgi:hypothetical protein